ncbi:AraC family transcriptional regulator [Clostridium guangxiense]|uniref:AraC family transcriptional regulator n=1 Tax=Clostridium guangxiense TaxID=1662055 RepID=UPI001E3F805E|nr:AraC family transcriptional regulator [Clostridium guangxiense]MCD2348840.1 AraC family transcriptional regulator [Clostridium guangxiense]
MLNNLKQTSIGFNFISPVSLLTIRGLGWQTVTSHDYIWNGKYRTDEHCLIQYTLSGEGELEFNNTTYKLKQGDAFIVEIPGSHCYRLPEHSNSWELLYIQFSKEALPFWNQLIALTGPVFSIKNNSSIEKLMWNIYEMSVNNDFQDVYQCSKYAYELIMNLISHFHKEQEYKVLPSSIEVCKQFINHHYNTQIGLDDMAKVAQISKFHLTRKFEKELGITPNNYLIKIRLENSVKLLTSQNNLTLEDIAKNVGFSCANYYGKVFKKKFGVSPDEFRRNSNSYEINRVLSEK